MGRKLKKAELMLVSRILNDLNFKSYAEYLLSSKLDRILKSSESQSTKTLVLLGDVLAFLIQNMHKAEDMIDTLIISYKSINQEKVSDMDVDEYIDALKEIFFAGIPSVISKIVDIDDIKKKITENIPNAST